MKFDEDTTDLYTNGCCYLLAYYLQKKLDSSEIYILESNGTNIHSLVFHKDNFYDINGKFNSEHDIIIFYTKLFKVYKDIKIRPMKDESELILKSYYKSDHFLTKRFVDNYFDDLVF